MNMKSNPAALLATLVTGLTNGSIEIVDLELDPNQSIEEQLEIIGAKLDEQRQAEHRKECAVCREAYEATQARAQQPKAETDRGIVDEMRAKVKAKHAEELAAVSKRQAEERAALEKTLAEPNMNDIRKAVFDPNLGAPYVKGVKPSFHEIGFMAFYGGRPIASSFNADRGAVEAALERFRTDPMVIAINRMMGVKHTAAVEIRPVYDKR